MVIPLNRKITHLQDWGGGYNVHIACKSKEIKKTKLMQQAKKRLGNNQEQKESMEYILLESFKKIYLFWYFIHFIITELIKI